MTFFDFFYQYIIKKNKKRIMGTIKILENKLIIKSNGISETYVKKRTLNCKSWIIFNEDTYELEFDEELVDDISDSLEDID